MTLHPTPTDIALRQDLDRIILDEDRIRARVEELGALITRDYAGRELVVVTVLKGALIFLSDLIRRIALPLRIEVVGASCYKGGSVPTPGVRITKDVDQTLTGRDVLLVEDIYDTGHTIQVVRDLLALQRPASLEICSLLSKNKKHTHHVEIKYPGFEIEDHFVVGYGLDYKELYRNLPCVGVLKPELYR